MSRWICIDDICIPSDENDWEELVAFADAIAEQEPIEIIRCRDCKYYYDGHWCSEWEYLKKNPDDFCSYGQRGNENVETD